MDITDLPEPDGWVAVLGLQLTAASGDEVRATIDVDDHHHQPYGIVHGGVYCSAVETVASIGAAMWFADRGQVVGVTNTTHFLRAVRTGRLDVVATPIHRGRTQQLWEVRITDPDGRLCSKGEVRLSNIADPDVLAKA